MKRIHLLLTMLCFVSLMNAQVPTPTLYIGLTSHNEMKNTPPEAEPYDTDQNFYNAVRDSVKKIVDMVALKNARYNLQTCQRFVYATHKWDNAGLTSVTNDILEYSYKKGGVPYGNIVEIDPRDKTASSNSVSIVNHTLNIADVVHMIDSTGATSSKIKGGFLYWPYAQQDWTQYTNTVTGTVYGDQWKAEILWGAGSNPPHQHDANNYGVWKPNSGTDSINFYCHNPNQNVWVQGNGCAWNLEATTNPQTIISSIRTEATKIKNGTYPANKFYVATVMFNFKHLTITNLAQKVGIIVDSLNVMAAQGKIVWKTITQKQQAFQSWSSSNGIPYSQWKCGQTTTLTPTCQMSGLKENSSEGLLEIYPNPANSKITLKKESLFKEDEIVIYDNVGRIVKRQPVKRNAEVLLTIDIEDLSKGIYFIKADQVIQKFIKE